MTLPLLAAGAEPAAVADWESRICSYGRQFPAVFDRADGAILIAEDGTRYIDFWAGAGALNYGHNNRALRRRLIEYVERGGLTHGLDLKTTAKEAFLHDLMEIVLQPRGLDYRVQFCGPTGTNAVEAAFKLARKVTGRTGIVAFMGGYHGMSAGALAATGNKDARRAAGTDLNGVSFIPFADGPMGTFDSARYLDTVLSDVSSGIDRPAAVVLEVVQAEGGIYVAPPEWLQAVADVCRRHGALLICDEIQVGCGRTGPFFAFEAAGLRPDIITLSKSISGYGLPMSLVLMRPELDVWQPGEHTGTFRGNQLAFVTARAALHYWTDSLLANAVRAKGSLVAAFLRDRVQPIEPRVQIRGTGLIWGIDFVDAGGADRARRVREHCFAEGLIAECCGRSDTVLKILPPLVIEDDLLMQGLETVRQAVSETAEITAAAAQ